jgi:hypothetical protein
MVSTRLDASNRDTAERRLDQFGALARIDCPAWITRVLLFLLIPDCIGRPGPLSTAHMRGWLTKAMLVGMLRVVTSRSASSLVRMQSRTSATLCDGARGRERRA